MEQETLNQYLSKKCEFCSEFNFMREKLSVKFCRAEISPNFKMKFPLVLPVVKG